MTEPIRHAPLHRSVFGKLMAIMLLMAVGLLSAVGIVFWMMVLPNLHTSSQRVSTEYARHLAGTGLDFDQARDVAARLNLGISYKGTRGSWATAPNLPDVDEILAGSAHETARRESLNVVRSPDGQERYLFVWSYAERMRQIQMRLFALLGVIMLAVIGVTHVVLTRLLRPLQHLGEGVARLAVGDLDIVVPDRGRDEFGALAKAFNQMVTRVRDMVRARDQLLLDVSHELRSPLTRFKVALAMTPDSPAKARMADDVTDMEGLIAQLLELERLRDGGRLSVTRQDLAKLVHEVAALYAGQAPGVQVAPAVAGVLADVDPDKVRMVLRNLIENALKYSLSDSQAITITVTRSAGAACIRVSDDGPGIPPGAGDIFEPFVRLDPSRSRRTGGYGLGLSICRRVMGAHGGTITLEPSSSRGASFLLTFPVLT